MDPPKETYTGDGRTNRGATTTTITSKFQTQKPTPSKPKKAHHPFNPFHHALKPSTGTTIPNGTPSRARPTGLNRQNSVQTRYMNMLLSLDDIPRILLAGFVIFPGTFTSLSSLTPSTSSPTSAAETRILSTIKNIKLVYIASFCCLIGTIGLCFLWFKHRRNFVWLLNKIFLPGALNGATGLMSTLVAVYSQQGGHWSVTARTTAIVTGVVMVVCGAVFAGYKFGALRSVKGVHDREVEAMGVGVGEEEEGLVEKIKRKGRERGLEPGSVV
ncbi:pho85 cyclin-1 protein [Rutstroemia sp. NJR-2017a BVV2]|nr:pho85 cyclin-1 protein [Rutstroemia sp. NJR-2017a BVV2]